jgi:polar amino acid transport system substrate-binding protein
MLSRLRLATSFVAVATALALTACGGSDNSSSSSKTTTAAPSATIDKQLAAQVPAKVKDQGSVTVAADATYAPMEFIGPDGKTVLGVDADLSNALFGVLGLKDKVTNATFDAIIPGLAAGKYGIGMSSFTDTKEREKTVDFVTYFEAGTSFFEKAQGGPPLSGLADLCGKSVAVEKGTTQQDDSTAQSKKCTAQGKKAVNVLTFPDQNGANLAISSGRAQVGMADSPVADYQVKKANGQFKLVGTPYGTAPYGIAVPKGSGMAKPLLGALKKTMADGSYKRILQQWGVQDGAITNPAINAATS